MALSYQQAAFEEDDAVEGQIHWTQRGTEIEPGPGTLRLRGLPQGIQGSNATECRQEEHQPPIGIGRQCSRSQRRQGRAQRGIDLQIGKAPGAFYTGAGIAQQRQKGRVQRSEHESGDGAGNEQRQVVGEQDACDCGQRGSDERSTQHRQAPEAVTEHAPDRLANGIEQGIGRYQLDRLREAERGADRQSDQHRRGAIAVEEGEEAYEAQSRIGNAMCPRLEVLILPHSGLSHLFLLLTYPCKQSAPCTTAIHDSGAGHKTSCKSGSHHGSGHESGEELRQSRGAIQWEHHGHVLVRANDHQRPRNAVDAALSDPFPTFEVFAGSLAYSEVC